MIMRLLHLTVVAALIVAAAFVYKIKFESTMRAAEVTRLAAEIKRQRDAIAALRAEWVLLDNPARIQGLVERHLSLKPLDPAQLDRLDRLPERPAPPGPRPDAIAAIIDALEAEQPDGALPPPPYPPPRAGEGINNVSPPLVGEGAAAGAAR
jgi:hypothetical protein